MPSGKELLVGIISTVRMATSPLTFPTSMYSPHGMNILSMITAFDQKMFYCSFRTSSGVQLYSYIRSPMFSAHNS